MSYSFIENHLNLIEFIPLIFFISILIFILIGWIYGRYQVRNSNKITIGDSLVAAIFGLSALVLGFAFAIASGHFDSRMGLERDQARTLKQIYQSSAYLNPSDRVMVQNTLKQILTLRISAYENTKTLDDLNENFDVLDKSLTTLNEEINQAIARVPDDTKNLTENILRPQLSHLLDVFQEGLLDAKKHPPVIIERFLFVLLSIGSLISGYTMAVKKQGDWFLSLLYLGLMGFALYVIFSLEYPHELQNLQVINADFLKLQKSWQ